MLEEELQAPGLCPLCQRARCFHKACQDQHPCADLNCKAYHGPHLWGTEYDRANVPPYNGNDPPPAPGSLKRSLFPTLLNEIQNKGTQGVRARYGAELPPIISIVRYPGRPVISGMEKKPININNFAGLSRKWVGVKLFMCFPFSWGKRETHKQNSQEISGKGRDSPGTVPG